MASNYVISGTVGNLLREELSAAVRHVIENPDDPVTKGIILNTSRVETRLGRGSLSGALTGSTQFSAQHPLVFGRAGTWKYANINRQLGTDNPPRLDVSTTYPAASDTPQRKAVWLSIGLKWMVGNLTVDELQLLALENGAPVEDFLTQWITDPAKTLAQQMTTDFFGSGDGLLGTCAVSGGTGTGTWSNSATEQTIAISGSSRPFWRGQQVQIYDVGSGLISTAFTVTAVHNCKNSSGYYTICLKPNASITYTVAAGDTIHLAGAYVDGSGSGDNGVAGLGQFFINPHLSTGTKSIHGLQVYNASNTPPWIYPELQSYSDGVSSDRWPTPAVFERAMDDIIDRGLLPPTRWIITRGIRTLWYRTEGQFKVYSVGDGGVMRRADGGIAGPVTITTEGGEAEVIVSGFCPKNTAWGIREDAFVHYAPKGNLAVRFLGQSSLVGSGGMWLPTTYGSSSENAYTTVWQAPFQFYFERGCLAPQNLAKLTNLKEHGDTV